MKNFSFKNVMYAIGTSLFLIMLIFTLSTSLINPTYGMSERAVMEMSSSSSSQTGTGWYDGYFCNPSGLPGDHCLKCGPEPGDFCSPANSGCPHCN